MEINIPEFVDISEGQKLLYKKIVKESSDPNAIFPKSGDRVSVHYTGRLNDQDGKKFDSSKDRGEPFEFLLGEGQVIKGWDKGVQTMKTGETAQFIIHPSWAYGSAAQGEIPKNSTLWFEGLHIIHN